MTEIQEGETNLFVATEHTVLGTLHRTPHGAYGEERRGKTEGISKIEQGISNVEVKR